MTFAQDPTTLHSRAFRHWCLSICTNNVPVVLAAVLRVIDELGGCVEVSATATDSLKLRARTLLPLEDVLRIKVTIEGKDVHRGAAGERGELAEESVELSVVHRAGLVYRDRKACRVTPLDAWMDIGIPAVDALDGGGALSPGEGADELPEDRAPVDDVGDRASDLGLHGSWHATPAVGLLVRVVHCLLQDRLHSTFNIRPHLLGDVVPTAVVVHGIPTNDDLKVTVAGLGSQEAPHRLALIVVTTVLLGLLDELEEIPLRGLHGGEGGDEVRELFVRRPLVRWSLGEHVRAHVGTRAGDETLTGKRAIFVLVGGLLRAGVDERVDGQVGGDVPGLGWFTPAVGEVAEDEVVKLVEQDPLDLRR